MIAFALAVAGVTLVCGLAASAGLQRLPTFRLQLAGLGLLAVFLPLAAVVLSGLVMFQSGHDLTILAVAAASSTSALVAAMLLGRSMGRSVEAVQTAAAQMAGGDLSARVQRPRQRELAALAATLNEMAARLEDLFDTRTQMVTWASHDLRTPLANIQAMLEALEDGLADPAKYVPALREQARTLGMLIDDLFELARMEAGAITLELQEAQLAGLVGACLRGIEAEADARSVQLETHVADTVIVRCAPEKIERVLLNLLTNSLRHTPSDGSVAVRAERRPEEVEIVVEDTGSGLEPDAQRRMFEHFWRGDPARATTNGGGAGLGLAIARALVEAHGGRIWAESRSGGGARVCFTLPAG